VKVKREINNQRALTWDRKKRPDEALSPGPKRCVVWAIRKGVFVEAERVEQEEGRFGSSLVASPRKRWTVRASGT
jgi:hypothetical protein